MGDTSPVPEGFTNATPYLIVNNASEAVDFYKQAFNATELSRFEDDAGVVRSVEIKIGNAPIMIGQHAQIGDRTAENAKELPKVSIYLYVEDADALFQQAVNAGATERYPVVEQVYGNREGGIIDPFGITWWIGTRVKDVGSDLIAAGQFGWSFVLQLCQSQLFFKVRTRLTCLL
jgi:PhnB protein